MSLNKVFLSGGLTAEPQQMATTSGTTVVRFSLAVSDRRKNNKTGNWDDYTHYVDCTMFGKFAESMVVYLHKGVRVTVEGKLNHRRWEKDGQKHSKIEVIVDELVPPQRQQAPQQPAYQQYQQPYAAPTYSAPQQPQQMQVEAEDIPF